MRSARVVCHLLDEDCSIDYELPYVALPAAPEWNFVRILWSSFEQPKWYYGKTKISGSEAAEKLAAVLFKIFRNQNSYHFKISAIGSYDMPETNATTYKLSVSATGNGSVS